MADTPPVAGPLPYWYTGAAQKRQFEAGNIAGFGGEYSDPIAALANPPAGAVAAEAWWATQVADIADGTVVYEHVEAGTVDGVD